jgi:hypothetical protein
MLSFAPRNWLNEELAKLLQIVVSLLIAQLKAYVCWQFRLVFIVIGHSVVPQGEG